MRALLIGFGGAGCRIVDTLNQHDERSGVRSVRSFVFDADQKTISKMQSIPQENRFVLTPSDLVKENNTRGTDFEVGNLASCFQCDSIEEIDAVFVCAGLGGRMAELVPAIVSQLNDTFPDPIFTILTLPGRNEGVKISARASRTLAEIRKVAQATILFDNETWFKRTEDEDRIKNEREAKHKATIYEMYPVLNELLARRVGLLLRAGEFNRNGVEAAEVVLDAGEVLNTLKEIDLVAIGYATEKLPATWTHNVLKRIRVEKYLLKENQARTSRIVELAKQAVYQEVSVPCDLTSSEKALVLIAGPSGELSMKGFQTVRKWIDRSIRGLEMRAGDYPVKSTRYVGVIIVLAGLGNVPRVKELDEIRTIYESEQCKEHEEENNAEKIPAVQITNDEVLFEDRMIMPVGVGSSQVLEEAGNDDIFELVETPRSADGDMFSAAMPEEQQPVYATDDPFGTETVVCDAAQSEMAVAFEEEMIVQSLHVKPPVGDDDVFENVVRRIVPPPLPQQQYMYSLQTATVFDKQPPLVQLEIAKELPKLQELSKIVLAGPKKQQQMLGHMIMLPKRQKKADNVLLGQANAGSAGWPKETTIPDALEGSVQVRHQRPKETDGPVHMSGRSRPTETMTPGVLDGPVSIETQRPKETEGHIRMAGVQKPKETDGAVSGGSAQRPKEIDGSQKVRKPREISKGIRVTSIPLPKNPTVKETAKKSKKDKWL
ncbi:MAG: tubulin/FtsZ family protein [Methanocalculaceae archaeon]|nr:tubulin/FtsZ family protein [Methanocalculaceae archaeon]